VPSVTLSPSWGMDTETDMDFPTPLLSALTAS
jgi:hypothetical protein